MNTELLAAADHLRTIMREEDASRFWNNEAIAHYENAISVLRFCADPSGDASRVAFEAHMQENEFPIERRSNGDYQIYATQCHWQGWQAALEAAAKGGQA